METNEIFNVMNETAGAVDEYIFSRLSDLKRRDGELFRVVAHLITIRQKKPKLRATLGRLVYENLGGHNWRDILPILAFMELSTIATYVLDDIIDNQPEREGHRATWRVFGLNQGMIGGSVQAFRSIGFLSELKASDSVKLMLFSLANEMWEVLWVGEGKNEHMRAGTTIHEYLDRSYGICGVMFETVAKMVGTFLNSDVGEIARVSKIARDFGTGVMIRNDLTVFLPEAFMRRKSQALSRVSFEDVRKGLWTYPIICAMERSTDEKVEVMKTLGNRSASEDSLLVLTRKLVEWGCIDDTLRLLSTYKSSGLEKIQELRDNRPRSLLIQLFALLDNIRIYYKEFAKVEKLKSDRSSRG